MELMKRNRVVSPLTTWRNFGEEMEKWFRFPLMRDRKEWSERFEPDIDVKEESDRFIVKADIPGLKKEDIEISVQGCLLTLKGERKEEKEEKAKDYFYAERLFGSFSRTMELSAEVKEEEVKAAYKDGVLEITLPKSEKGRSKQVKVEIK
jgi:HSP20 family protein